MASNQQIEENLKETPPKDIPTQPVVIPVVPDPVEYQQPLPYLYGGESGVPQNTNDAPVNVVIDPPNGEVDDWSALRNPVRVVPGRRQRKNVRKMFKRLENGDHKFIQSSAPQKVLMVLLWFVFVFIAVMFIICGLDIRYHDGNFVGVRVTDIGWLYILIMLFDVVGIVLVLILVKRRSTVHFNISERKMIVRARKRCGRKRTEVPFDRVYDFAVHRTNVLCLLRPQQRDDIEEEVHIARFLTFECATEVCQRFKVILLECMEQN